MLSCPVESSQEWKDLLARTNGNRDEALRIWNEENGESEPAEEPLAEVVADEKVESEEEGFTKLINSIKLFLSKKHAILSKKVVVDRAQKEQELELLLQNFEAAEGVESINMFVRDAHAKAKLVEGRLNSLMKTFHTLDRKEAIAKLGEINDFINGYSILDEISKSDIYKYFNGKVDENKPDDEKTPQELLTEARSIKDAVKNTYINNGIPLMADFLLEYSSDTIEADVLEKITQLQERIKTIEKGTTSEEHKKKRTAEIQKEIDVYQGFTLDKKGLIQILREAQKDESMLDFLISPLISSHDASLSLFAKAIKSQLETARLKDLEKVKETAKEIDKYATSTSANIDNKAEFNEGLYVENSYSYIDPKTKEKITVNRTSFVEKYDMAKFVQARKDMYASLGEKPVALDPKNPTAGEKALIRKYKKAVAAWYSQNKEAISEAEQEVKIQAKIAEIEKLSGTAEAKKRMFDEWKDTVYSLNEFGAPYPIGEFTQPNSKYISDKWKAMYNEDGTPKNAKGEYHKYLVDMYIKAQDKLPPNQRPGMRLPSIPKTTFERDFLNTLKTKGKDAFKVMAYDTEFGLADFNENSVKSLPIYYTQPMDSADVSLDLARSVLMFNSMVNRYDALNEVHGEINLMQTISNARKIDETNSKGVGVVDAMAAKLGYTEYLNKRGPSNSKNHLDAFIDMIVYGEMQKNEELFGLSVSKITNSLSAYSAVTTIAADVLKGVANNLQGNIQMIIEANSGQFFNKSALAKAKAFYASNIPSMLADFGKRTPESFVGKLVELYDGLQGSFVDQYGKTVTNSVAIKLMSTDTLFFNQHFGEHEIQISGMLALMSSTFVIDKATGEKISLLEAHQKYDTTKEIYANTDFTEKKRQDFQNRLHALNKRMHGVYNSFDMGTAQRFALGRLAVMYRKHLVPGYKRRFKGLSMDQELGTFTEGFYNTFWKTFLKDAITFKWNNIQNWSTYTAFEKAQTKRVIAEISIILTTAALVSILTSMGDDDDELKESYMYNFVLYEMIRMNSETAAYISPRDAYRVVKSPSAMTGTLERAIKFTDQFFLTWDPEKLEYQRKQGVWEKGDNKSWAYFLKLMGYSGYNIKPEAAVESFKGILK